MKKYQVILAAVGVVMVTLTGCKANPSEEGVTLLQEEKYEAAVDKFEEAIEAQINVADAYHGIGIAKWELQDYEGAKEAFLAALEQEEEPKATLYNFLGNCELELEQYEAALGYYQSGMECEDSSEEMLQEMRWNEIICYEKLEDWENAKDKATAYAAYYPEDEKWVKEAAFLKTR